MAVHQRKKSDYAVISLRIKEPLRAKVEKAAKRSGTSMNSEIAARLERSFADDEHRNEALHDAFGGEEAYYLLRLAAAAAAVEQAHAGKPWPRDAQAFDKALSAINAVFQVFRPKGKTKPVDAFTNARALKRLRHALYILEPGSFDKSVLKEYLKSHDPSDLKEYLKSHDPSDLKLETDIGMIEAVKAWEKN